MNVNVTSRSLYIARLGIQSSSFRTTIGWNAGGFPLLAVAWNTPRGEASEVANLYPLHQEQ